MTFLPTVPALSTRLQLLNDIASLWLPLANGHSHIVIVGQSPSTSNMAWALEVTLQLIEFLTNQQDQEVRF
jgi:hypothetical protein